MAANNSISDNYDVISIFNSVQKILLKILIISDVLMEGQSRFVISYIGNLWAEGWERAPHRSPLILALHFSPKSTVTHLAVHDYDLVH